VFVCLNYTVYSIISYTCSSVNNTIEEEYCFVEVQEVRLL
jgi:hypothetical protein